MAGNQAKQKIRDEAGGVEVLGLVVVGGESSSAPPPLYVVLVARPRRRGELVGGVGGLKPQLNWNGEEQKRSGGREMNDSGLGVGRLVLALAGLLLFLPFHGAVACGVSPPVCL
jgi:hypothetical protein